MEKVPVYLLCFYVKIRKHADEEHYLYKLLVDADEKTLVRAKSMLQELVDMHFIAMSDNVDKIRRGRKTYEYSVQFITLARPHYYWSELLTSVLAWSTTAFLGAVVALIVARFLG